jgi:hypothetical protein
VKEVLGGLIWKDECDENIGIEMKIAIVLVIMSMRLLHFALVALGTAFRS